MIIARSLWRKGLVTAIAAGAFVSLYEVTMLDSRYAARLAVLRDPNALPAPGSRLAFTATAYCRGVTTASGVAAQKGVAAADPEVLPVGSVIEVENADSRYNGIYTVMDTGPAVQGRQIDVYMWNCDEAVVFGRRPIQLTVLRLGWNPRATTPSFTDRIFKRAEPLEPADPPPLPSRPLVAPTAGTEN
jgi:3D (Asp-Asp-Asp) domain-containing protein